MTPYLLSFLALLAAGLAWEAWARRRDRRSWPAPGQMVDVGGHRLHARCHGSGNLVVVFEADEGSWSTHWGTLPERFAQDARVVAYDRGGLGWSDGGPPPRDAETLARELHQLLRRLVPDAARRTVLVAHGTGAHVARLYAHRYPFETAGLVLVDPHPDTLADRLRREQVRAPAAPKLLGALEGMLARFGVLRLLVSRGSSNLLLPLPDRQRKLLDALELDPRVRRGAADELAAEARTLEQVGHLRDLTALPTRLLVAGATLHPERVLPSFPREEYDRLWAEEASKIARSSSATELTVVEDADHLIPLRSPELVEAAVRGILVSVAAESPVADNR